MVPMDRREREVKEEERRGKAKRGVGRGEKVHGKAKVTKKSAVSRMSSTEDGVASPAAAVLERRLSRTTPKKRRL